MRVFSNNIYRKLYITPICHLQKYSKTMWKKIKNVKIVAANCLDYQLRAWAYQKQGYKVAIFFFQFLEGNAHNIFTIQAFLSQAWNCHASSPSTSSPFSPLSGRICVACTSGVGSVPFSGVLPDTFIFNFLPYSE